MSRIGFDARMLGKTGIGTYVAGLLESLPQALPDDQLVVFVRPPARLAALALLGDLRNVEVQNAPGEIYRLREQLELPIVLIRAHLDLLHAPHYNQPIMYRRPTVVTVHDLIPLVYPAIHSSFAPRLWNRLLIRQAVHHSRRLITPSRHTASDVQRYLAVPAEKITIIPEAADGRRWQTTVDRAQQSTWMADRSIRAPYLLYTGTWAPYKNILSLLEAFALLLPDHPDIQLVIGGQPDPRYSAVSERARQLPNRVVVTGWIPETILPGLMHDAQVFVFPSAYEGFGLPVLEAMAAGTPVVCAAATSLPEVSDGAAILWDISSGPTGLADAIVKALDPRQAARLRELGLMQAARFSWRETARRTVGVYRRAL